jgi:biopolymer transport protein ExbD
MTFNTTADASPQPREVRLEVTDSGQYILAGQPVALSDLRARLHELKSIGSPINLHVTGGPKVEYRYVMPAMQVVQEEGLGKVGLLTVPPAEPEPSASGSSK